jgi:CubicO group peptidase (beta-lactamase class C family)
MIRPVVRPAIRWSRSNNKGANNQLAFKSSWRYLTVMMALAMLLSIVAPAVAQADPVVSGGNVSIAPTVGQGPTDPAELEIFLDDFFATAIEEYHIAGAAVAVVKDGKLFFTKGYGYKDIEHRILVDPEQTMFRIGSNTKPFTWTAVMQLAEQGKVDLDADINTYLDFRIPDTFPQPITLKHLMTHTSGFGERWLESLVSNENQLMSEREWLVSNMPARIFAPGEAVGYSNYNAMLAGYIVSRISGQPYPQYIQQHILDPLRMSHSTATAPAPPELQANLSAGYRYVDGGLEPFPNYQTQPAGFPSGVIQASVTDMARFMIAQLGYGRYSDQEIPEARILQENTARQMQDTPYPIDPRLRGMTYAFSDLTDNGVRTLGHQGYFPPMGSQMLLLPDQRLGIFLAVNTRDIGPVTTQHVGFQRAFFDHYFPAAAAEHIEPPADFAGRADRYVGLYRRTSYPPSTPDKVGDLFGGYTYTVSAPGDGTLTVSMEGLELRFVEVEPLYFRQIDGSSALVFFENDHGRITRFYTDFAPQYSAKRAPWYELRSFNMPLVMVSVLLFISVLIAAPVQAVINRRRGAHLGPASRTAPWILGVISLLNLVFLFGMLFGYHPPTELHDVALPIKLLLTTTVISALLTAAALVYIILAWKNRYWSIASRVYYTLVTAAALAFVWFLNQWNLLGWQF